LTRNSTVSENFGLNKINNLSDFDIIKLASFSPISGVRRSFDTAWVKLRRNHGDKNRSAIFPLTDITWEETNIALLMSAIHPGSDINH
jgi:hypothetical protein